MLFRKMFRDIKINKTQFLSILLMSLLGVLLFSGFNSEWTGLKNVSDEYYKETNLADFWIYGNDFSEEQVDSLLNLKEVKKATRRFSYNATVDLDKTPTLTLNFVDNTDVSKIKLMDGAKFSTDKDGIWLDKDFAKAHKLEVGDSINITINNTIFSKKIKGLILHPEYIFATKDETEFIPNHKTYGFAFLSNKAFPEELPLSYNQILISTTTNSYKKIESLLNDKFKDQYSVLLSRDNNISYATFNSEIEQHKSLGNIFPILFLAIAMLTVLTTMTRIISKQRTEIGTLKALGFKRRKILCHYVSYGFFISLIGAILGMILGPLVLPPLIYAGCKEMYTLTKWEPAFSLTTLIIVIITVSLCTFITYIACAKSLKETPAEVLRPKAPKALKQSHFERTTLWKKLGFNLQWNLRDIMRSKVRSLMAIIGVMGCTALLLTGFGLYDSMKDMFSWQYDELNKYESKFILEENITSSQIDNIINTYEGESIEEESIEIQHDKKIKSSLLTVIDNNSLIKYENKERKYIDINTDKISISQKLADVLNIKSGDKIKWHIYGDNTWHTGTVGTIYNAPLAQGITLSKDYFENLGYKMKPTSIITKNVVNDNNIEGVKKVSSNSELKESSTSIMDTSKIMIYALIILAVLLALVVLYNLGVLSFTEKVREYATLKVLGFKSKKIRSLLITQNIILTVIAIIIGIPCGYSLIKYMSSTLSDNFSMDVVISIPSLTISLLGTFIVSILVNFMFSKKIKSIDMVSSLKGVE